MRKAYFTNYRSGIAALFIVVVVGASALLMALGASKLGIGELTSGFIGAKGDEMLALADGCLEEALERIRYNKNITVDELKNNLPSYTNGSCIIQAVYLAPHITLTITARYREYNKIIRAKINPTAVGAQLVSWEEV